MPYWKHEVNAYIRHPLGTVNFDHVTFYLGLGFGWIFFQTILSPNMRLVLYKFIALNPANVSSLIPLDCFQHIYVLFSGLRFAHWCFHGNWCIAYWFQYFTFHDQKELSDKKNIKMRFCCHSAEFKVFHEVVIVCVQRKLTKKTYKENLQELELLVVYLLIPMKKRKFGKNQIGKSVV